MGAELTETLGQWTGMPTLLLAADNHSTTEVNVHLCSSGIMVSCIDSHRYSDTDVSRRGVQIALGSEVREKG